MIHIGAFQAKTHFSEILRRVAQGEEFCITHHGKVVAILVAPKDTHGKRAEQAFGKLLSLRQKHPIGKVKEIISWKDKDRK